MPILAETIKKYLTPSRIFVETGTFEGDGIQAALDAGAEKVYSIDQATSVVKKVRVRFAGDQRVEIIYDNSVRGLERLLPKLPKGRHLFWLDAHDGMQSPILYEIHAIENNGERAHTILIDDMRLMDSWGVPVEKLKDRLLKMNPNYCLELEDGCGESPRTPGMYPMDILAAEIRE